MTYGNLKMIAAGLALAAFVAASAASSVSPVETASSAAWRPQSAD